MGDNLEESNINGSFLPFTLDENKPRANFLQKYWKPGAMAVSGIVLVSLIIVLFGKIIALDDKFNALEEQQKREWSASHERHHWHLMQMAKMRAIVGKSNLGKS